MTSVTVDTSLPWTVLTSSLTDWAARVERGSSTVLLAPWQETIIVYEHGEEETLAHHRERMQRLEPPRWEKKRSEHRDPPTVVRRYDVWRHEFIDLCAAVELDRVGARDIDALLKARRTTQTRWTWEQLMDGAFGLRREHAPGELAIGECMHRAGLLWRGIELRGAKESQREAG